MVRLQKFLADAGIASRRSAEQIILEGRVSVNGHVSNKLGIKIDPDHDYVSVDGKSIRAKRKLYLALNKPKGLVCSRNDEHGRATIYDLLPSEWTHLHSVGRLDFATEGLIFLTNDGNFSLRLTHPRYGIQKKYLIQTDGRVSRETLALFVKGIWHQDEKLKAERARLISASNSQSLVELDLTEGKNREVRRLFESQAISIKRLQRVQIGNIKLGQLKPGKWRTLTQSEIKSLLS